MIVKKKQVIPSYSCSLRFRSNGHNKGFPEQTEQFKLPSNLCQQLPVHNGYLLTCEYAKRRNDFLQALQYA